jgi:hypothetical protein
MVARTRNHEEDGRLVVTLTDGAGRVLHQETCRDGTAAAGRACYALDQRRELQAGDLLRVTVLPPEGEVHNTPRELD